MMKGEVAAAAETGGAPIEVDVVTKIDLVVGKKWKLGISDWILIT